MTMCIKSSLLPQEQHEILMTEVLGCFEKFLKFAKQIDLLTDHKEQIQLPGKKPGLYIIKLQTDTGIYTEKLIIR